MSNAAQPEPMREFTKRVFSGVQPSGGLTLGNYLGAIKRFVHMQDDNYETIYCVVDLHAITVWQNPNILRQNTRELAASFIASGLDPEKSILFKQSSVPEHAQLGWVFNCVARMGWMQRMTQFKDKAGKNAQNASLGLFGYPALMAADILAYHATHVPVGDDQKQHLELTRDIAIKFNHDYDVDFFPITEPVIGGPAARVMSLRDGTKKMSKSDPSDLSRINMTDDSDTIANKIRKAKTDQYGLPSEPKGLEGRAEARNLVSIYAALGNDSVESVLSEIGGKQFSEFKPMLVERATEVMSPISSEMGRIMKDIPQLDEILDNGARKAKSVAEPILQKTFDIIGMK
jgi:tryptophanyl-tRNA synthetase